MTPVLPPRLACVNCDKQLSFHCSVTARHVEGMTGIIGDQSTGRKNTQQTSRRTKYLSPHRFLKKQTDKGPPGRSAVPLRNRWGHLRHVNSEGKSVGYTFLSAVSIKTVRLCYSLMPLATLSVQFLPGNKNVIMHHDFWRIQSLSRTLPTFQNVFADKEEFIFISASCSCSAVFIADCFRR